MFAAAVLAFAYLLFLDSIRKTILGKAACTVLLLALTVLQGFHWWFLADGVDLFENRVYVTMLLLTPPSFYFFSREILLPEARLAPWQILHLAPVLLGLLLDSDNIVLAAFALGAAYSVWFVRVVLRVRRQVRRFRFEVFFFSMFALFAILVLVLASTYRYIDPALFYIAYANFTGIALLLVVAAMIVFPGIIDDISDAAALAYAKSTLDNVDVEAKLAALEHLMRIEKIYENEDLNLAGLADAAGLSPHQLSELINTHFGYGFSRYLREQRIREARRLLAADSAASVLSISLATGFRSQSNFYAAFREITGIAPGRYRKSLEKRRAD